jgi:DNA-binding protein H-NS
MEKHGVTTADIESYVGGKRRGRKPSASATGRQSAGGAKYRDPKSGATWTGHGRAPAWIANAKDRSKFLITEVAAAAALPAKNVAKAGNYVRGPQPPKYRDPKSGATWSGRGRAPAWISGAKDPSKLLIAENEVATAKKPAAVQRGAVAKKATAAKKVGRRAATAEAAPKGVSAEKKAAAKNPSVRAQAPKNTAPTKRMRKATAPEAAASSDSPAVVAQASENI